MNKRYYCAMLLMFSSISTLSAGLVTYSPTKDDSGEIVIKKDQIVAFTATPDSGDVVVSLSVSGSAALISGIGNSRTATFGAQTEGKSHTCTFTVTHTDSGTTCTDGRKFTAKVTVLKIESQTIVTSPSDRARTTIGVGEEVNVKLLPHGLTSTNWEVASGGGNVAPAAGTYTVYTATGTAGAASIKGTYKGISLTKELSVIKPSGILLERVSSLNSKSPFKAGFAAFIYVQPATVNFYNIAVSEGACGSDRKGYFNHSSYSNSSHGPNGPHLMNAWVASKGTEVDGIDQVWTAAVYTPYSDGSFTWPIPWTYKVASISGSIGTINHQATMTVSSGTASLTVTKAGGSSTETVP